MRRTKQNQFVHKVGIPTTDDVYSFNRQLISNVSQTCCFHVFHFYTYLLSRSHTCREQRDNGEHVLQGVDHSNKGHDTHGQSIVVT